jgi:1,6-anhydro-N-acetylmuramate kinase
MSHSPYTETSLPLYRYQRVADAVVAEIRRARLRHAPMRGGHEGYAVILEELDELWEDVRAQRLDRAHAGAEAIQVAAMAIAFAVEVCGLEGAQDA